MSPMWSKAVVIGWLVLTGIIAAYELWTNFNGSSKTPTLTDVTVQFSPWWATLSFLLWLLIHFATNYAHHQGWTAKWFHWFAQD